MTEVRFEPQAYGNTDESVIGERMRQEGWSPLLIADPPGAVYPPHRHAETKLLVFLRGSMEVHAGGTTYHCVAGDKLIIPGSLEHAALVGPDGYTFFWSEQLRGSE